MFPYPSGAGLHVGHPLGFIGTDVFARYKRMTGHNVLHTMGFDAFGLPAEQYAVQTGQHPAITTEQNIANMPAPAAPPGPEPRPAPQHRHHRPGYYRWTQWIFLQIFNSLVRHRRRRQGPPDRRAGRRVRRRRARHARRPAAGPTLSPPSGAGVIDDHRLAYVADAPVNWCPGLGTVVANEEVTADGRSDRGNFPVFKRNMRQWMMRITAYADRLIDDLDLLDWTDAIKAMQRNWIGRSEGAVVRLRRRRAGDIAVFTTRPDTLFGATFMVLAPEHPLVDALTTARARPTAVADVPALQAARARSDFDRQDESREKTGVFTGVVRHQPGERRADPGLDRRLRADGLRHRRDHGRAVRRPARLRVRPHVRPADPRHPAAAADWFAARHRADARHVRWPRRSSATRRTSTRSNDALDLERRRHASPRPSA